VGHTSAAEGPVLAHAHGGAQTARAPVYRVRVVMATSHETNDCLLSFDRPSV
jgi:hypothetical protein